MLSAFSGAVMDRERKHRFLLWRFWDERPRLLFIGLNPSTANELTDDPTIRRLMGFARDWGCGGLYACNIFSQVTPDPKELDERIAIHKANYPAFNMAVALSDVVLCGWGDGINKVKFGFAAAAEIRQDLHARMVHPICFGLTASGNPRHPLYLPKTAAREEY